MKKFKFNPIVSISFWVIFLTVVVLLIAFCGNTKADSTYIDIEWTAKGDNGNVGCVSGYCIAWSYDSTITSFSRDSCLNVVPDSIVCAGETQKHRFYNVPSDTIIYVAVWAYDKVFNWSGISNITGFRTPDINAPDSIDDLRITGSGLISYGLYKFTYELARHKPNIPGGIVK